MNDKAREDIIEAQLSKELVYWALKRAVKEEIIKPKYQTLDLGPEIYAFLEESGLSVQLRNLIVSKNSEFESEHSAARQEPVEAIEKIRLKWERRIREEFNAIVSERKVPLAKRVEPKENEEQVIEPKKASEAARAVFDHNDLLDALTRIQNPHYSGYQTGVIGWGLIKVELRTPQLADLRSRFHELSPEYRQCGLDDEFAGWFADERRMLGARVAAAGYVPVCRQFARRGVPVSLRAAIWARALEVDLSDKRVREFWEAEKRSSEWELATDDLHVFDVKEASNDENMFVFEEMIRSIVLTFSRDSWVSTNCVLPPHTPPLIVAPGGAVVRYPPSGVFPFKGLALYVQPLCFMYGRIDHAYLVFRSFYARHFCRLQSISSADESIVRLCKLFEELLQVLEPTVFFRLLALKVPPLRIAFPWIMHAFSGVLPPDQTLVLWDRILGFDSLLLLPVLAVAMFAFRAKAILKASSVEDITDIFHDSSRLKVVPLLQHFLFSDRLASS